MVQINGKPAENAAGLMLSAYLSQAGYQPAVLAGERGGEILNLPSGTQIIPHDVSKRVAGGQTVQVYVTVQGNIIGNRQYADELGETIVQRILRALDNM